MFYRWELSFADFAQENGLKTEVFLPNLDQNDLQAGNVLVIHNALCHVHKYVVMHTLIKC